MTTKKPLVSIVTITFNLIKNNRVNTFNQCVESVHNQTYKNIEHLIIDGASDDGTKEVLKKYEKKGLIKFISEPDTGIYNAMNKGINLSNGEYIAFLNSDDYYHGADGILESIETMKKSKSDFSYSPIKMIDKKGDKINFDHPQLNPNIKNVFFTMPCSHQSMFFRRSTLLSNFMFDDSYKIVGDYDLILRMCLNNLNSVRIKNSFATFRYTGISSVNMRHSLREVSKLYLKNYGKICDISKEECNFIYDNGYTALPYELANKLKDSIYFDFERYIFEFEKVRKSVPKMEKLIKENSDEFKKIYDSKIWICGNFVKNIFIKIKRLFFR